MAAFDEARAVLDEAAVDVEAGAAADGPRVRSDAATVVHDAARTHHDAVEWTGYDLVGSVRDVPSAVPEPVRTDRARGVADDGFQNVGGAVLDARAHHDVAGFQSTGVHQTEAPKWRLVGSNRRR